jgi:HAD superfamily hydrolase (TIGR01549 family)
MVLHMSSSTITTGVVVFDQGNTLLLDPFLAVLRLKQARFTDICRNHGITDRATTLCDQWAKANRQVDYPYISHFCQEEPIIQAALRSLFVTPELAATLSLELLKEYRVGLAEVISSDPRTEEVRGTLKELKRRGKKLGVFSNDRIFGLSLVLNAMQIESLFEYIETSESIRAEKPDHRVFEHMVLHFHIKPDEIVYVGDDIVRDVEPAKNLGLKAIYFKVDATFPNEHWRDYRVVSKFKPDATIEQFSQLLNILP